VVGMSPVLAEAVSWTLPHVTSREVVSAAGPCDPTHSTTHCGCSAAPRLRTSPILSLRGEQPAAAGRPGRKEGLFCKRAFHDERSLTIRSPPRTNPLA
jgi:hypothetical protein